jgi:flagellar biosynthesis anti-sigma factor FlgM
MRNVTDTHPGLTDLNARADRKKRGRQDAQNPSSEAGAPDEIDAEKVARLRKAIADGTYEIDADAIAAKIVGSDRWTS